jgi:dipeptidyl aminopeptidase/acylaminoacyl peptidase
VDTVRSAVVDRVRRHLERVHGGRLGSPSNLTEAVPSPDGRHVAVTAAVRDHVAGPNRTRLHLLGLDGSALRPLTTRANSEHTPRWSPDGRLAFLADAADPGVARIAVADLATGAVTDLDRLDGVVESIEWDASGATILAVVAGHNAQQAGARGSGSITPRPGEHREPWEPWRLSEARDDDWRRAWVVPADGSPARRVPTTVNVWEATWVPPTATSPAQLLAIVSDAPDEDAWYGARLTLVDLDTGAATTVATSERQLGVPVASPDGRWIVALEAPCSDRTLVAGHLVVVEHPSGAGAAVDARRVVLPVDAVQLGWLDADRLFVIGERSMDTVAGIWHPVDGSFEQLWETPDCVGGRRGEAWPIDPNDPAGGWVAVRDRLDEPMAVVRIGPDGREDELWSIRHAGTDALRGTIGGWTDRVWHAPDGWEIHGWFLRPAGGDGPLPTVVLVHGGPVASTRRRFHAGYAFIPLLLEAGYAVFAPNPRGSSGRGFEFADAVHGDMGGADVDDVLTGIDALIRDGLADPDRLCVTGASYGGYLTCRLVTVTDRFRAAAAFSPVTNWYSQHHTTNIPQWDVRFLADPIDAPGGLYWQRSPVFHAAHATTPTLLGAGLLDRCTPPGQALEFHRALALAGVPSELEIAPGDAHAWSPGEGGIHQLAGIVHWFERWCPPG